MRVSLVQSTDFGLLDVETQVKWLNDPEVVRFSEQRHKAHTIKSQREYIHSLIGQGHFFRGISLEDNLIGTITAYLDHHNSLANVGILIGDKTIWGHGYGYEAWRGFCDHLLDNGVRKIEAGMMGINFGMIHICRKYGMRQEARIQEHFLMGGQLVDLVIFGKGK